MPRERLPDQERLRDEAARVREDQERDRGERWHARVRRAVEKVRGPLVTTDFVLAEADFLILRRLGAKARAGVLTDTVLMAVAERLYPAPDLTLDRRHFAPFRTRTGRALDLLPGA